MSATEVLVGLQGERLWSLQLRDLDGPVEEAAAAPRVGRSTASDAVAK